MRKFYLELMAVVCLPVVCHAAADDVITVRTHGGDKAFATQNVRKITFDADGMSIAMKQDAAATEKILFSDVRCIVFEDVGTGLLSATAVSGKLRISSRGRDIVVLDSESGGITGPVDVYTMAGVKALSVNTLSGNEIDVSSLSPGTYILKISNATVKFHKK